MKPDIPPPDVALRPPDMSFHARYWDLVGWEPRVGDHAGLFFTPSDSVAQDVQTIKNSPLSGLPPQMRSLLTTSIKGTAEVLDQLINAEGFGLGYLAYDLEGWDLTPPEEQTDPIAACRAGQELAHQYGLVFTVGPTASFSDRWGEQMAPYVDIYTSQAKGIQDVDYRQAIAHQRELYARLKAANPDLTLYHDNAIEPKGNPKPLTELLDYYHGLSDMVDGIGTFVRGDEVDVFSQYLLTLRPPLAPPAGDTSPVIRSSAAAFPNLASVGETVSFTADALDPDGDSLNFTWEFGDHVAWGDGHILVRGQAVSHAYDMPGNYIATVRITDGRGGVETSHVTVTVNDGASPVFTDVPANYPYRREIEALYLAGYTDGCSKNPLMYCPEATMNRAESAVFVERGLHSATYDPPVPEMQVFADLPLDSWAAKWVNGLWQDQYTAGCGTNPLVYCPWQGHTRAEGCVFYLRMLNGATYDPPPPAQQTFGDVPLDAWYAKWVQGAFEAGLLTACQTTPELRFCPNDPLSRAMAAYMMVQAKGLVP